MQVHPLSLDLSLISKHRQFLYGFAALWIMFFHFCTRIPEMGVLTVLSAIQQAGSCGSEIFIILTGMGLYQSMKHTPSIGAFYKKRFIRVFLPAFIIMATYHLLVDSSVIDYLASITFFGYWLGADVIWYIPFILTMYLMYPFLFRLQSRKPATIYLLLMVSIVFSFVAETLAVDINILRGISRIPIFLVGCIVAPHIAKKKQIPSWVILISVLLTILLALPWYIMQAERKFYFCYYYFYRSFLFAGYAILSIFVVSACAQWMSERKACHGLYRFFAFCGMISLEMYLFYERIWMTLESFPGFVSDPFSFIKLDVAAIICTFILSVVLQRLTDCLIKTFATVKIPNV